MNLTVNQPTNTNFKATIKSTKYLKEGVKTALREVEFNPQKAQAFYDSFNAILKSNKINNFSISAKRGSVLKPGTARPYQIKVDGYKIEGSPVGGLIFDGEQCVEHIIDFAKKFIGKRPPKKEMNQNELLARMTKLKEQVFKGERVMLVNTIKEEIKAIKCLLKNDPEFSESYLYQLKKLNNILKIAKTLKPLDGVVMCEHIIK